MLSFFTSKLSKIQTSHALDTVTKTEVVDILLGNDGLTYSTVNTLMCLSIGTPENNKFSICSKWKIHYFQVSQKLGRLQPHDNVLEYWDT